MSLTEKGQPNGLATLDANGKLPTAQSSAAPSFSGDATVAGNLILSTAGKGIKVKEGTNATMGTAVLVAGAKVVSTTAVTASSRILLTSQVDGGTPGWLRVSARTAGTSFTITSSSGTDTSTVGWVIVEPSP